MCLAVPGKLVSIDASNPTQGTVSLEGVERVVSLELVQSTEDSPGAVVGSWVLVHVGFALTVVDEDEAQETLRLLRELGEAYDDEIAALESSPTHSGNTHSDNTHSGNTHSSETEANATVTARARADATTTKVGAK